MKRGYSRINTMAAIVLLLSLALALLSGCAANDGSDGKSAYELAVEMGYTGTLEEWLASLGAKDGVSVTDSYIDNALHLWLVLSDGTRLDAGYVGTPADSVTLNLNKIKDFVITKQLANCEAIGPVFLHASDKSGTYSEVAARVWTSGFYPGLNYLCYEMSGNTDFKEVNDILLTKLPEPTNPSLGHDIGMIFSPSAYASYTLFRDSEAKALTIAAGEALMARFNSDGEYIKAWDWGGEINDYRMIIDTMYNVPLLFRCYELTQNIEFYNVALKHSKTAMKYLVRDDYTTAHTYLFNPDGTPKGEMTHQGYSDDSCWARGQGWAISGFAMAYRFTNDESFLETAIGCAAKYIELAEENLIPKWDLIFKGDDTQPVDTSAAAIAANGFMEIYDATGIQLYKDYAYLILSELYENYSSKDMPAYQGLIREAVGNMPQNTNISVSLIYGDYYFVELLSRLLGTSKGYW